MRIAICDDEKRICSILAEKVEKIFSDAEIMVYASGAKLLFSLSKVNTRVFNDRRFFK